MEELKKERTTAKRRFNRKVRLFKDAQRRGDSIETLEVLYTEVSECFEKVDVINEQMIEQLKDGESCQEYEEYIKELETIKYSLLGVIKGKTKVKNNTVLALKKLEPPKFSGSVRAFPAFVRDYERLVVSQHGKDPYVLRISLEGEPRRLVEDIDDYKRMWDRLNEAYGNEGKLIDAILGDIRAYKPLNDSDDRKLINLINTVEKVWLDVSNLSLTTELENTTVLTQVERLLPSVLKREWAIKVQELNSDKFKNLVTFLTDHRKALEYLQDNSRSGATKVTVHTVEREFAKENELAEAIKLLTIGQEKLQNKLSECLTSLYHISEGKNTGGINRTRYNSDQKRKNCPVHDSESHELKDCMTFKQWSTENQMDFLRQKGVCYSCLRTGHFSRNCEKRFTCRVKVNGEVCGKHHHSSLHTLFNNPNYLTIDATSNYLSKKGAILMTGFVNSEGKSIPTLYDAGSNISLITFRMARKLGLKGIPIQLTMTKVGDHAEELVSCVYEVSLRDQAGIEKLIEVCGVSEITAVHHRMDLGEIARRLEVQEKYLQRPEGRIELLIGSDYCTLLPQVIKTVDNIQLLSNDFGLCIRGRLEQKEGEKKYCVQINHISYDDTTDWHFRAKPNVGKLVENYFLDESLRMECIPKCGGCKCGECSVKENLSIREERELKLIEDGLTYDEENNADLTTRKCNPRELDTESVWKKGPEFLYQDSSEWPVKQSTVPDLPDVFARGALNEGEINSSRQLIDIQRFSNVKRLLSVMARIISAIKKKSFKAILCDPSTEEIQQAELYFVKNAQGSLPQDWEKRYRRLGPVLREDGIITVGSRMSKWLKDNWDQNQFILLPPKHPFSLIYLSHIHQRDHSGVESSLARAQVKYLILGARKTMKSIRKQCVVCRRIDKICTSQAMGEFPKEGLEPCPPWHNVSLDLFGPFWVCDTVKRRVKRKIFGVILNCMVTRAVHLDISEGYDIQNVLTVLKRFTCLRGFPKKLYSDSGTQLVSANKELREMVTHWNKGFVFNFGKFKGLTWVFNKSADAPWENACSESLIRLVKRSLTRIIGESVISFGELQSVMYEVANMLNERPIGFKPGENFNEGTVLRPNDLLLGRYTIETPCGFWNERVSFNKSYASKMENSRFVLE
ncbi:uncharacterized protein [Palaemon carinicauda]|uniref:uncharacterized protein n=1 Tax=Palaemon carinicauda TaxID=392227 RepID=UPI0035B5C9DB